MTTIEKVPQTTVAAPSLKEKIAGWFFPSFLIVFAIYYWIVTLITLPFERPFPRDFQTLRHRAFSKLWIAKGDAMSEDMPGNTIALIGQAKGRVLDIGPGTGANLHRFHAKGNQIKELWGVEPATDMHAKLKANAEDLGFGKRFHALACGAEPSSLIPALAKQGLLKHGAEGIFDDICLVRVLCGVPQPQDTIQGLYRTLKPGGRFLVCEHIANPWPRVKEGSFVGRVLQFYFNNIGGWRYVMGGCELERNTADWLKEAASEDGGWGSVDLEYVNAWATVPWIVGTLTKKGGKKTPKAK